MRVKASLNNLRIAPRKVRLVAGLLGGMDIEHAKSQLKFTVKRSADPISKLLDSAAANAENNFSLVKTNLFIKEIRVDEGRKLKRYKPKGFGRAMPIQKKTSHISIVLEEKVPGLKVDKKQELSKKSSPSQPSDSKQTVRGGYKDQRDIGKEFGTKEKKLGGQAKTKMTEAEIQEASSEESKTIREKKQHIDDKQKPKGGFLGNFKKKFFRRKSI